MSSTESFAASRRRVSPGAGPTILLAVAAGLVIVAMGNNQALTGGGNAELLFWAGLTLVLGPVAVRLWGRGAQRPERLVLVVTLGVALFLVKVLHSPAEFTRFDEFGSWRATHELVASGHAFNANPLTPAVAGYPALATITAALSQTTGLSIFTAGLVVVGVARATLMLVLFLFFEQILDSPRAAGLGVLVYACNSSFLYFDSQFAYESLALPLAVAVLLVVVRWSRMEVATPRRERLGVAGLFITLAAALTVTHHLSSIFVLCFLAAWGVFRQIWGRGWEPTHSQRNGIWGPVLILAVMIGLWLGFVAGHSTLAELGDVFSGAAHSIANVVSGKSGSKRPFSGTGESTNPFERGLIVIYVLGVSTLIAVGLWTIWRRRVRDPLFLTLTALALLWPLGLALRLTQASTDIAGRVPEFVFLGAGFLAAYLIAFPLAKPSRRAPLVIPLAFVLLFLVVFCGGFVFGELKATRQPGPFLVGAEDRSITPQGVAAAKFAGAHLPSRSSVLADRDNAMLLAAYGDLDPLMGSYAGFPISRVLLGADFDRRALLATRERGLEYVLVDRRLRRSLPVIGYYVESEEPSPKAPVSSAALSKFGAVAGTSKLYTNGPISIYALNPLRR